MTCQTPINCHVHMQNKMVKNGKKNKTNFVFQNLCGVPLNVTLRIRGSHFNVSFIY